MQCLLQRMVDGILGRISCDYCLFAYTNTCAQRIEMYEWADLCVQG